MSYSRWSDSVWYTFWSASASGETIETQAFEVCGEKTFYYPEIKNDVYECLKSLNTGSEKPYTNDQLWELREYMLQWLRDVEREFQEKRDNKCEK